MELVQPPESMLLTTTGTALRVRALPPRSRLLGQPGVSPAPVACDFFASSVGPRAVEVFVTRERFQLEVTNACTNRRTRLNS